MESHIAEWQCVNACVIKVTNGNNEIVGCTVIDEEPLSRAHIIDLFRDGVEGKWL
jgi:hypothetical protein